jgi:hypothetical protein
VIHFEPSRKEVIKLENNPENIQPPWFERSPELLWEEFEKTGSVETYLQYLQTTKNASKPEFLQAPS